MNLVTRILLWTGLAGVILIGLIEGVMWAFFPAPQRVQQRFAFDNEIPGLKQKVTFSIDERSLRSFTSEAGTGGKTFNIVCLGGSGTAGIMQSDADTWWGQLATLLHQQHPTATFKCQALTVENQGALFGAKWVQENLASIPCDYLVVSYGFDDIVSRPGNYAYDANRLQSMLPTTQQRSRFKSTVVKMSQMARRVSASRQRAGLAQRMKPFSEPNYFLKILRHEQAIYAQLPIKYEVPREEGHDPMVEYMDAIKALSATCKARGVELVVFGEPTLHAGLLGNLEERLLHHWFSMEPAKGNAGVVRLDSGWVESELNRYGKTAAAYCQKESIPYANLQGKLLPTADHFVDDVLLTDRGALECARIAYQTIKPLIEKRL